MFFFFTPTSHGSPATHTRSHLYQPISGWTVVTLCTFGLKIGGLGHQHPQPYVVTKHGPDSRGIWMPGSFINSECCEIRWKLECHLETRDSVDDQMEACSSAGCSRHAESDRCGSRLKCRSPPPHQLHAKFNSEVVATIFGLVRPALH